MNPSNALALLGAIPTAVVMTAFIVGAACSTGEDPSLFPEFNAASATPPRTKGNTTFNPDRNLHWGDLHVHTATSAMPILAV